MVTIVTRAGKGSMLSHAEVDANFNNLNAAVESGAIGDIEVGNGGGEDNNGTAVGIDALESTDDNSINNTAVGRAALSQLTGMLSTGNTAVGYRAGRLLVTGANNVFIGYHAGVFQLSGDNNTVLGAAPVMAADTDENSILIGNAAVGLGSNTTVIGRAATVLAKIFGVVLTSVYTVATLPAAAAGNLGARAFVTDASTTLALGIGTAVTGGGANKVPVYSDGAAWLYG